MKDGTLVMVPARMGSTRLPDKPMAVIGDAPMIVQVARRAQEADIGTVVVATDADVIAEAARDHGFTAVMTRADHASGSDRIFEAAQDLAGDTIVNVQGDLPTIDPAAIRASVVPLADPNVDFATLAALIVRDEERDNENVVKLVGAALTENRMRALYFTRATAPHGPGPLYHHIGLYAWRRAALARFVALPPSTLEVRERLEQLRGLEAGMRCDAMIVDTVPLGVDTAEDLERARRILT